MYKMPKTKPGALLQYDSIWRAYRRTYAGGGMFRFDWPTFRMNAPNAYAHIQAVRASFAELPN